jgi:hypothetical protein
MLFFEHNMIKDIPSSDDFIASGEDFLNMAWEKIFDLLKDYAIIKTFSEIDSGEECNEEIDNEYWEKVQRHLSTSLALIQQGNEFILKGKIAKKSPFLILSDDWDSTLGKDKDISFSKLKTIEASNLIKVYNAEINPPLENKFQEVFDKLRDKRNTVIHSVPNNIEESKDLLLNILEISQHLIGKYSWIKTRKSFLENEPNITMVKRGDNVKEANILITIATEINHVIKKLLGPKDVKMYFDIDKKQRWYICPYCYKAFEVFSNFGEDFGEIPKLAQLKPKKPGSNTLYCLVCDKTSEVKRDDCNCEGCRGNVISDSGICLTCGNLERPTMIPVTLKIPVKDVEKLQQLSPILGFSDYQLLIGAYINWEMRANLEKLENNGFDALIASLKRHGVSDDVIHEALTEIVNG